MPSTDAPQARFCAVVFRRAPPTSDFSCSDEIALPGRHTAADGAWSAVRAALAGPGGEEFIGGTVRAA